jgi:hypothetical protein
MDWVSRVANNLTYAEVSKLLKYDASTGSLTWAARPESMFSSARACNAWNARYAGKVAMSLGYYGYRVVSIRKNRYMAHRIVWLLETGAWPSGEIDHIDQNRSNNCFQNLRDVPRSVNMKNKKRQTNNSSGLSGVSWMRANSKWAAYLNNNGKRKHLGLFSTKEEAFAARLSAASSSGYSEIHGIIG